MSSLQVSTASFVRQQRPDKQIARSLDDLTARLAIDEATRNDAFSVRHESYLSGGYIDPKANGVFADHYDEMPNSQSMVIYKDQRPVASVRVCILDTNPALSGWGEIPASNIFADEVKELLDAVPEKTGNPNGFPRAIEINRLVRHPDFTTDYTLVFALFRLATFMVYHHKTDFMMSCVRRNHSSFYKRLHFNNIAGPRRYAGVKFETNLMACYQPQYDNVLRDVPIVDSGAMVNGCYDGLFLGETVAVF
jgi:hypothetical protein